MGSALDGHYRMAAYVQGVSNRVVQASSRVQLGYWGFLVTFTLLLSFTGYLLPWDQLAMWAVTVGTNMARATPFLGSEGPFQEYVFGVSPRYDARSALLGGVW